jgi:hypothetical protein
LLWIGDSAAVLRTFQVQVWFTPTSGDAYMAALYELLAVKVLGSNSSPPSPDERPTIFKQSRIGVYPDATISGYTIRADADCVISVVSPQVQVPSAGVTTLDPARQAHRKLPLQLCDVLGCHQLLYGRLVGEFE